MVWDATMRKRETRAVQMAEHWRAHSHLQRRIKRAVTLEKEERRIHIVKMTSWQASTLRKTETTTLQPSDRVTDKC